MRIEGPSARGSVSRRPGAKGKGSGGAVFQPGDSGTAAQAAPTGPVHSAAGIESILALQGVDDPRFAKKRAVRHGQSMLDALEDVKAELLTGAVGEGHLNRLMALVTRARQQADPDLEALIDDIELRARVELAKLGRFAD